MSNSCCGWGRAGAIIQKAFGDNNTWMSDTTGGWVAEFTLPPLVSLLEVGWRTNGQSGE